MDGTPYVGPGGVDGRVQTEACGVHWEATAALLHHLSQNVYLNLGSKEETRLRAPALFHTWTQCILWFMSAIPDGRSNGWPWCWGTATGSPACGES